MSSLNSKTGKVGRKKTIKSGLKKTTVHNLPADLSAKTLVSAEASAKTEKKTVLKKAAPDIALRSQNQNYIEGVGRRKTSVARVRIIEGGKNIIVNGKDYAVYFPTLEMKRIADGAFDKMGILDRFGVKARISGGGIHSQAEALRHGLARALIKYNADFRKRLKKAGYLKRDPRMKERRKFGLKKARKSPQWKKR